MKLIALNTFVVLVLFTSCNSSKKTNQINSKDQTPEINITKKSVTLENTKWKLVTLMGQDVSDKNAFIRFSNEDDEVYGNGSCNNFSGTYQIKEGNRITLSKIVATLMACVDMKVENQFMAILEKTDNYSLNGNKMTLNKARMVPLAVFEVVETK
ncbi:META domain-containing protein [Mariniflexile litorale]|uniref:META domain-containing protein n=1 Tax=Mariniflexile litorale TaxID=3045158 RepID=A0AAU7EJR0_9FLAO|nr:META domain-containing protein [Mariniflexile sp. KMM 9835]MDQ8211153.1 META domain-containing protein [Mariniflexile sp. KMM 9835]